MIKPAALHPLRIVLLLLVAGGLAAAPLPARGQAPDGWSEAAQLSPSGQFAWFPDVITDPSGRVHAVWSSGFIGYDSVMYTSKDLSGSWQATNDIISVPATVGSEVTRPALAVDQLGYLNMTFRSAEGVFFTRAPLASAISAQAWSTPIRLSLNQQVSAYFSRLVVDAQDTIHAVYTENKPASNCAICYHVFYRQSADHGQTWSSAVDISTLPTGSAKPQILVDGQGALHVVWESGYGGTLGQLRGDTQVLYTSSSDGGKTWNTPFEFRAGDKSISRDITIGADERGNLVVAWLSMPEDLVFYATSQDHGVHWSDPQKIPGVFGGSGVFDNTLDDYSMATDGDGNVHLALVGRTSAVQAALNVIDVVWDGKQWSAPTVLVTLEGDVPEWPRIAIGIGNQATVVWDVRDQAHIYKTDEGQYTIWAVRGVVHARALPTLQVTVDPTATLPPVTTPAATLASATPEAIATLSPDEKSPADVIYTEGNYVSMMGKVLLPSLLFLAVVGAVILIRRR